MPAILRIPHHTAGNAAEAVASERLVAGTPMQTVANAYSDAGNANGNTNLFRWTSPQWIYNLDTGKPPAGVAMTIGTCYRLDVYIDDSHGGTVRISGTGGASGNYAIFQPTK